jgi:hypothetical protein
VHNAVANRKQGRFAGNVPFKESVHHLLALQIELMPTRSMASRRAPVQRAVAIALSQEMIAFEAVPLMSSLLLQLVGSICKPRQPDGSAASRRDFGFGVVTVAPVAETGREV